jgi:hypothetical protein
VYAAPGIKAIARLIEIDTLVRGVIGGYIRKPTRRVVLAPAILPAVFNVGVAFLVGIAAYWLTK